jgi:hypothetical protein
MPGGSNKGAGVAQEVRIGENMQIYLRFCGAKPL